MDPSHAERFIERVIRKEGMGTTTVYAVLDTARGHRVFEAVRWSSRPYLPLYGGPLAPEIERVAPYLVELGGDHAFTRRVLTEGWGSSWGCFIVTPLYLEPLRLHLRSLLRVRTERGQSLLFRYYDPRVLRVYLPTCTRQELTTFFGPITRFIAEDEGGAAALTFERSHGEVAIGRHPVG
jgi:hypothetical protein